jgi:hypothetical protein
MGLLIGVFAGKTIIDVIFSRAVFLVLPWAAASAAIALVHAPAAGYVAGIAALVAMLLFATTPPLGRVRLALIEGMMVWCGLAMVIATVRLLVHMIGMGLVAGFVHELRWIAIGMGAVAVAGLAEWRFEHLSTG